LFIARRINSKWKYNSATFGKYKKLQIYLLIVQARRNLFSYIFDNNFCSKYIYKCIWELLEIVPEFDLKFILYIGFVRFWNIPWKFTFKMKTWSRVLVAYTCNPSYSGGRDEKDRGLKPAWANSSRDPILKNPIT
jgi:hypothetical protein